MRINFGVFWKIADRQVTDMSVIGRNIFANFFGIALVTALTVAITPAQIRILGVEAFGIVGFIATLQLAFTALDLGLSSTLTRELAADHSEGKKDSVPLVRSALFIYFGIAIVVGALLALLSGLIARHWFNAGSLRVELIERSLQLVALFLALRWPVALYTGVLSGFQRLDTLNIVKSLAAIFRLAGGLIVLLVWRTLESYLWWIAFSALVEVALYAYACRHIYALMPWAPAISRQAIQRVWKFSLRMNLLGILALMIVQMDRLIVSKQLSLVELGNYNLAYTLATGLALITGAISSAVLPAFAALRHDSAPQTVADQYIKADRLMLSIVGFAAFTLMAYGDVILHIWVGPGSAGAVNALMYLALGFWCNSISAIAYNFAVAKGRPERFIQVNMLVIIPYALLIYFLVNALGIEGAALAWVALNLVYIFVLVRPVHKEMVGISTATWITKAVLPVAIAGGTLIMGVRFSAEMYTDQLPLSTSLILLFISCVSYGVFVLKYTGLNPLKFDRKNIL